MIEAVSTSCRSYVEAALLSKSEFGDCPRNFTVFYHIDVGLN